MVYSLCKNMYPKFLVFHKRIFTFLIIFFLISSLLFSGMQSKGILKEESNGRKYAVIIVGRYAGRWQDAFPENFQLYYGWYLNAAGMMYQMLEDKYGYSEENIFLLTSLRNNYEIPKSFNSSWIDFNSNKQNLQNVLKKFKHGGELELGTNDSFLFSYINHGNDDNVSNGACSHNTFFGFPYEFNNLREIIQYFMLKRNQGSFKLYDWELAKYLSDIHAGQIIFLLQPCYSGGFINDLSGINHIICTASQEDEVATTSWIEPFIRGLNGEADINNDSKVSILEAYEYTAFKINETTQLEHPIIDDNGDKIGHHYTEAGYDPCNPNADGYLAARTYL